MLEGVIYNKFLSSIEYRESLTERQLQIDAVDVVLKLARDTISSNKCWSSVTLDIKNVFISLSCE